MSEVDEILVETDDQSLCSKMCAWIVERHGELVDLSTIPEHERVVLCVWGASGIIDNGGFNALFEHDISGDPHFLVTDSAFKAIGSQEAIAAFARVFRLFPGGKPPAQVADRLNQYRQGVAAPRSEIDQLFWKASKDIHLPLAAYIRAHREDFLKEGSAGNARASVAPTQPRPLRKRTSGRRDETTMPDRIAALPHWARVALAGRCARLALPEFRRAWPNALPKRLKTVQRCIVAAEQSALRGRAVDNLDGLTTNATVTVGAAIAGLYGNPFQSDVESPPRDGNLAVVASKAARVALMAAEAARNDAAKSAHYVSEAVCDTIDVARTVTNNNILRRLTKAIADLERKAARQRWDDDSPVPPDVFTKRSNPRRPWWKFW